MDPPGSAAALFKTRLWRTKFDELCTRRTLVPWRIWPLGIFPRIFPLSPWIFKIFPFRWFFHWGSRMIWKTSIDRAFLPLKLSISRGLNTNLCIFPLKPPLVGDFLTFFGGVLESLGDSQVTMVVDLMTWMNWGCPNLGGFTRKPCGETPPLQRFLCWGLNKYYKTSGWVQAIARSYIFEAAVGRCPRQIAEKALSMEKNMGKLGGKHI